MVNFYLTDTIYFNDNKLYYEKDSVIKQIKKHNWHSILNDYGWEKLNTRWIKKLNTLKENSSKNSLFGSLDCGGNGDCLFHCISYALKSQNLFETNFEYEVQDLRKIVCDNIDQEKFNEIIEIYKILKDSNDFDEFWDPYEINFEGFKELIMKGGNNYWGDNIILNILKEKLNINIIILNSNSIQNQYNYYPLLYEFDEDLKTIILSYEDEIHFKLVGYFNESMITYFNKGNIPNEILKLIKYLR